MLKFKIVCIFQSHEIASIKYVQFLLYQLYLNKVGKNNFSCFNKSAIILFKINHSVGNHANSASQLNLAQMVNKVFWTMRP